ncbi:MAG: DNA translocase FtsK [Clostridia bacterium]|jgi:S-DNA-T family DNA segregation ATPase FtsK/SpoIIIE|nr:DNA translocase FtsK [Clostridia bacterium]
MEEKMAKRKKRKTTKKGASKIDLTVVGLIVLSILLAVLIYGKSGVIGVELNEILGGMMGIIRYVLPIGIFAVAIKIACADNKYITSKLIQYAILLISISVLISVYQINKGELSIVNKDISKIVKDAYLIGAQGNGGGALGAILATPLVNLLGQIGATILCIGVVAMLAVFTFGINMSEIINNFVEKTEENREERYERKQQLKEEQLKIRQEAIEKRKKEKIEREIMKEEARQQALATDEKLGEQIKINFGGRILDEEDTKGRKKYDHKNDDLTPLTKETKTAKVVQPDVIENNIFKKEENSLFKQEEEKKEDKTKEVLQLEHAMVVEDENYEYPPIELLGKGEKKSLKGGAKALTDTATKLQKTLYSFGVSAKVENVSVGPAITRYELKPAEGVRVSKIANLADDIALNLAAETIRIEAPIPGKQAVGIEVPNKEKEAVHLREVLESEEFQNNKSKLSVALGKDVAGNVQLADIAKMPHVLIAGSTGSGKSVCINTIITSIIYNSKPSEVKMVMVDPKVVELSVYNGIPHLLIPVVTDPKKAAGALAWAVQEMDNRYNLFAGKGVRDLKGYNNAIEKENGIGKLPQIVIIVDELADLMMVAAKDVEEAICRLAQKARAAGMHLVIATQRPSVDVITGLIKANVPSRIAFAVSSQVDSRTILDSVGAEKLLGKGDMLFFPSGAPKPVRVQGAFVSDDEVEKIVDFVKQNGTANYSEDILETIENNNKTEKELVQEQAEDDETDPFLMDAIDAVVEQGQASTSFIQRRFKVGYARAGRIIDQMEERGIISGYQGSKPREVLITKERLDELKMGTEPQGVVEE